MSTKLSRVNPGMTFEVYGSMNQKAVIKSKKSEIMYTPTSQVIGSESKAASRTFGFLNRNDDTGRAGA